MENFEPNLVEEPVVERKNDTLGLLSLIFGIISVAGPFFGVGFGIAAFVLGLVEKSKQGVLKGKAKAGFILGILGVAIPIVGIICYWAVILITYVLAFVGVMATGGSY